MLSNYFRRVPSVFMRLLSAKAPKVVVVGAVAAGGSAAARCRRLNEDSEIVVFEKSLYPSFANCGLPYYVSGAISNRDDLIITPAQEMRDFYNMDVRIRSEVVKIDREKKVVTVVDRNESEERTYEESYDKLILAPGAKPFIPPIPGHESKRIYTLRNLHDMDAIVQAVGDGRGKKAVIVGAGFIGLELAENMLERRLAVTVVEMMDQLCPVFDRELTLPLLKELEKHGADVKLGCSCTGFKDTDHSIIATCNDGSDIEADIVVMAIGVRPDCKMAVDAGLKTNRVGAIIVNEFMQTSDPDIYAAGDTIEKEHFVLKTPAMIPLANPANREGRVAADHIMGHPTKYRGVQGTAILKVFDATVGATGCTERLLKMNSVPYFVVRTQGCSNAGYYPGFNRIHVKCLFDPKDGRLLGAQAVGGVKGVDKRLDVFAMAIQAGMTCHDLEQVELSYAPPFGTAKDIVNMVGFIACGIMEGRQKHIRLEEVIDMTTHTKINPESTVLVDVRHPEEYAEGCMPSAINIPLEVLRKRMNELPKDKVIQTSCRTGMRAYMAALALEHHGFKVENVNGGYEAYDMCFKPCKTH
eukprot:TRINITY_DN5_c0_g1_i11.p1 TRINITY_DN5_c0_g1~~TRINITY_DN5_c0_g1_i11.p1  ORF type:complete len:583 (+),score=178.88 TRINITY_DN5_c0_g1_i11:174-1922(+)